MKLKTTPQISKRMANVKLKRNKVETALAKALWHKGYRYRLNYKKLPGSPDIALTKYKIAIFVDGEFWHGKDFENKKPKLISNKEFWVEKIQENIGRDQKNDTKLRQMGWVPVHLWSDDVSKNIDYCISEIEEYIYLQIIGMDINEK
ncbi:very short patch repair endonuclease [Faecalicoccus pleomorphus]|uniref:Very short patch repair endonuclease n=1 Tax=Faecalicoccus pleomorphus TaxID=1323 RepID=A0A380LH61_9FIRM|nr:very short patch repair endonuclease [Faecalicoccus pleomorphus]SUO03199.1 very short patch repair endonuclease [Faecalicoccus pleomorphus]